MGKEGNPAYDVFILTVGSISSTIISLASTMIIARILDPVDYGIFNLIIFIISLISYFDLGLSVASTFYIRRYTVRSRYLLKIIFNRLLIGGIIIGVTLSFFIIFAAPFIAIYIFNKDILVPYMVIAAPLIYLLILNRILANALLGIGKMNYLAVLEFILSVLKGIAIIWFILISPTAFYTILGLATAYVIADVIMLIVTKRLFYVEIHQYSTILDKEIEISLKSFISYGAPFQFSTFLANLMIEFFIFLAARYLDLHTYSYFISAFIIFSKSQLLIGNLNRVLFAHFTHKYAKDNVLDKRLLDLSIKFVSYMLSNIFLIFQLIPNIIIMIILGDRYLPATCYLRLFSYILLLSFVGYGIVPSALLASQKTNLLLVARVISLALSLILLKSIYVSAETIIGAYFIYLFTECIIELSYLLVEKVATFDIKYTIKTLFILINVTSFSIYLFNNICIKIFVNLPFINIILQILILMPVIIIFNTAVFSIKCFKKEEVIILIGLLKEIPLFGGIIARYVNVMFSIFYRDK